jgi:hypothetical protein
MISPSARRVVGSFSVIIAISVIASSCQPKAAVEASTVTKPEIKTPPPDIAAPQTTQRDDGWQRMKECAERTDRAAKQAGWIEGQRTGNITVMGWQNHYSPKYGKCYLQVNYLNQRAETNPNVPSIDYELYDAFEEKLLSSCTDEIGKATAYCTINNDAGPHFDCNACRHFVKDRMEN